MNKIEYKDIGNDKNNLLFIISEMVEVYNMYKHHTQVLECHQWITMLNKRPLEIEYTSDALLCLQNILNDATNYLVAVEHRFDDGELAMNLMNNIIKLFNVNKNEKD
jgi:hypothetical protein